MINIIIFLLLFPPTFPTVLAFSIILVCGTIPDFAIEVEALFSNKKSYNFSLIFSFL